MVVCLYGISVILRMREHGVMTQVCVVLIDVFLSFALLRWLSVELLHLLLLFLCHKFGVQQNHSSVHDAQMPRHLDKVSLKLAIDKLFHLVLPADLNHIGFILPLNVLRGKYQVPLIV